MLTRVDRYIGRTVLGAILIVLIVFAGLNTLFAFIEELGEDEVGYGAAEALVYMALTTPRRIYELMPYVIFIGSLVGLSNLANQSELIVLRAAGMSVGRIFGSVSFAAALVLVLTVMLGEWIAPWGEETGEAMKAQAEQESETISFGEDLWYREGNLFMSVAAMDTDGNLFGIRQFQTDENKRMQFSREAVRGRYLPERRTNAWLLEDVTETRFGADGAAPRHLNELLWHTRADPDLLRTQVLVEPRKLSMAELQKQINYMRNEELNSARYELAFWSKLLQPVATLGLTLLAVSFIMGPLREVGVGVRIAAGIFVGLSFKYLQDFFGPMAMVYALPAWLAVSIPIVLAWAAGWYGLRKVG